MRLHCVRPQSPYRRRPTSQNRPPALVLTEPALVIIVAAIKEGRVTFQRVLTYTLNSILKKLVAVLR